MPRYNCFDSICARSAYCNAAPSCRVGVQAAWFFGQQRLLRQTHANCMLPVPHSRTDFASVKVFGSCGCNRDIEIKTILTDCHQSSCQILNNLGVGLTRSAGKQQDTRPFVREITTLVCVIERALEILSLVGPLFRVSRSRGLLTTAEKTLKRQESISSAAVEVMPRAN